ncbi:hypothetical protein ISN76_02505 [Dyella halodurans]|uniref:Uncharacterized protein n=1 Tax=Dyella halodurans TaxID=1920171 RepID=A0ABV9BWY2_9GAMM|nr:hypothetical protein [Dyella halodurans]
MKSMMKIMAASALVWFAYSVAAAQAPPLTSTGSAQGKPRNDAASTVALRQRQLDFMAAPIKSAKDLQAYLAKMPKALSPIEKLSPGAKKRFLDGLVFNENGLVGYDYSDLAAELPASDVYRLMSLFGAQRTVPLISGLKVLGEQDALLIMYPDLGEDDHGDYRCIGGHNCVRTTGMICMTGC